VFFAQLKGIIFESWRRACPDANQLERKGFIFLWLTSQYKYEKGECHKTRF
jgi:hypothetical protein